MLDHGEARNGKQSPEYRAWANMVGRCTSPTHAAYKNYGARGISVCARWRKSYPAFLEDMGRRPSPEHSLDRIDNDGNYEPQNCRWATRVEQARNMRRTRKITLNGETKCLAEWRRELGISGETFHKRLAQGMSPAEALVAPHAKRPALPRVKGTWRRGYGEHEFFVDGKSVGRVRLNRAKRYVWVVELPDAEKGVTNFLHDAKRKLQNAAARALKRSADRV